MVDTGIDQDPFEPSFQGDQQVGMPGLIKLLNVFIQLDKGFIHHFFRFFKMIGIPDTYLHSKTTQQVIQFLLAVAVILPATRK
jgi:hypothetical protein